MKKLSFFLFLAAFLLIASGVVASSDNQYGKAKTPPFPQPAEEHLRKVVFIRWAPGKRPLKVCGNGICEPGENPKKCPVDCPGNEPEPTPEPSACYGFLTGAKPRWNWVEDYYYNSPDLATPSAQAVQTWESPISGDIFGSGLPGSSPWGVYDYQNSISYGDYEDPSVLAVTAIWFQAKKIYEYDIMFDTDYFPDGDFDLDTVALHEFGHAAGLDDLYEVTCQDAVMYGYLDPGETKTDLEPGDIFGITTLYGQI